MYYFEAYEEWKLDSSIFSLFSGPEKYHFPCIQFSLNVNSFLLDTVIKGEDDMILGQRYIFGSIKDVLNFMTHSDIEESTISLLSPRHENDGEYAISDIIEVLQAFDSANQSAYIFCCKNKKRYIDSALDRNESDLRNFKTVYKQG